MKSEWLWDKLARNWDKPGVSLGENDIKILGKTGKYLNDGSIVLDYGCATGSIVFAIADKVKEVHGIDLSSKMVDISKRKAEQCKTGNTKFMQAEIFDERLKEGTYDVTLALNILHLLENMPRVMNRINHLLKPGGIFISASPCLGNVKFGGSLLIVPVFLASKTGVLPHVNFFSVSRLTSLITNNNFNIIETEYLADKTIDEILVTAKKVQTL